jgi:uncharacterized membrane protein
MWGRWDDQRVERIIGNLLRWGVILSAIVVQAGGIVYLVRHGGEMPRYAVFRGEPSDLRSIPGIIEGLFGGRGRSVIQFGLLLLIATPVARVAFSMAAFALERDRLYVLITAIVLGVLVYSLAGGA